MFAYAEVEKALARVNSIDESKMGAFRGRLQNYRRIGIVPASPGKGSKVSYEMEHIQIWAFCLELAQFGVDPMSIKKIVDTWRKEIIEVFAMVDGLSEDIYIAFRPDLLSFPATIDDKEQPMRWITRYPESELSAKQLKRWLGRRAGLINISNLKKSLDCVLGVAAPIDAGIPAAP